MTVHVKRSRTLYLASRSPRRRRMLHEAGVQARIRPAEIDDGRLDPGDAVPAHWVMALAYLKGRWVADDLALGKDHGGFVLAADTVCVHGGRILGQPNSAEAARRMLGFLRDDVHETLTGVCIISLENFRRRLLADRAIVHCGSISDDEVDDYIDSGQWRGKAGGYNLKDRIDAGWPIECQGDPDTVMGLPMRRLTPWLDQIRERSQ